MSGTSFLRDCTKPKPRNSRGTDSLGKSRTSLRKNGVQNSRNSGLCGCAAVHGKRGCTTLRGFQEQLLAFQPPVMVDKWTILCHTGNIWEHLGTPNCNFLHTGACAPLLCAYWKVPPACRFNLNRIISHNETVVVVVVVVVDFDFDFDGSSLIANAQFCLGVLHMIKPAFGYPEGPQFYCYRTQALIRCPQIQEVLETNLKYRQRGLNRQGSGLKCSSCRLILVLDALDVLAMCHEIPESKCHAANFSWATRASVYLACHLSTCIKVDPFSTSIEVQMFALEFAIKLFNTWTNSCSTLTRDADDPFRFVKLRTRIGLRNSANTWPKSCTYQGFKCSRDGQP